MILLFFSLFFNSFFSVSYGSNVLDVLNKQTSGFNLEKHLKKDVGSVLPSFSHKKELSEAFEKKDYQKALKLWSRLKKSSFLNSSTGQALYSFLMFKNGYEVLGLNNLFSKSNPKKIDPIVYKLWKMSIDEKDEVWTSFITTWKKDWTPFFGEEIAFKAGSKAEISIVKDKQYIEYFLGLPLDKKNNQMRFEWLLVLHFIKMNDMDSATKILTWLLDKSEDEDIKNKIYLTIGRLLYGVGESEMAVHYYEKVKESSFDWFLAQEEKSWIYYHQGEYGKSYAQVASFSHPELKPVLNSNMITVFALSQLKNCDYSGFSDTLLHFKTHFSNKYKALETILNKKSFNKIQKDLFKSYSKGFKSFYYLPSGLKNDYDLKNLLTLKKFILSNKGKSSGFKFLDQLEKDFISRLDKKINKKIGKYLRREKRSIEKNLKLMSRVELEVLYRIHGYHENSSLLPRLQFEKQTTSENKSGFIVKFPYNSKEIWKDEIGSYQTSFSLSCPKGSYVL